MLNEVAACVALCCVVTLCACVCYLAAMANEMNGRISIEEVTKAVAAKEQSIAALKSRILDARTRVAKRMRDKETTKTTTTTTTTTDNDKNDEKVVDYYEHIDFSKID